MNTLVMGLNQWGDLFVNHFVLMLLQAGTLIVLLWLLDCILYRHLKASLRYGLWMLVLIKLILSPHLSLPTGVGHWVTWPSWRIVPSTSMTHDPPVMQPQTSHVTPTAVKPSNPTLPVNPPASERVSRPASPPPVILNWQGLTVLIWLCLVGMLVMGLALRTLSLARILRRAQSPPPALLACLDDTQRLVACPGYVDMRVTDELSSPVVCRIWRPVILIPRYLADTLPEDKQRAILIHELCHIKRLDPWVNLAQTLLQVVYFYHPLVWWANTCIRRVREQAVDEMALIFLKDQRQCYSHTLIDVAQAMVLRTQFGMGLIGVSESKTQLNERIKLMLYRKPSLRAGLNLWSWLLILALGGILLPMSPDHRLLAADSSGFTSVDTQTSNDLFTQLEKTERNMITAFNEKRIADFMQGYCDDVIDLPPSDTTKIGSVLLQQSRQTNIIQGVTVHGVTKRNQEIWISGDLIYVVGPYAMSTQTPEISGMVTDFRYGITIWQRQPDGSLRIKVEAFNPDKQPMNPLGYGTYADNTLEIHQCADKGNTLPEGHPLYDRIRSLETTFHQLFVDQKRMEALDYYTEDALLSCTGSNYVHGKAALRDLFIKTADQPQPVNIDQQMIEVQGNEHLIYVINLFNWTMKNPVSGQNFTIPGKGIHIWQRQADGSWKIHYDMNSPDLAL